MAFASPFIYARCPKCYERVPATRIGGVVTLRTHSEAHSDARCEGSNLTLKPETTPKVSA